MVKVVVGAKLVVENESRPAYMGDVVFLYQFK